MQLVVRFDSVGEAQGSRLLGQAGCLTAPQTCCFGETPKVRAGLALTRETRALPGAQKKGDRVGLFAWSLAIRLMFCVKIQPLLAVLSLFCCQ